MSNEIPERLRSGGASTMRGIARRAAAAALAVLLVWGQVPAAAWAEAVDAAPVAAQGAPAVPVAEGSSAGEAGGVADAGASAGAGQTASEQSSAVEEPVSAEAADEGGAVQGDADAQSGTAGSRDAAASANGVQDVASAEAAAGADPGTADSLDDQEQGQVTVQVSLYGRNAQGEVEVWVEPYDVTIDAVTASGEAAPAGDAFLAMMQEQGIVSDLVSDEDWHEVSFTSITSPFDEAVTLTDYKTSGNDHWQFFVDRAYQSFPDLNYTEAVDGASYAWCFGSDRTLPQPEEAAQASVEIMGVDAQGNALLLASMTMDIQGGMSAAELTQQVLDAAGLAYRGSTSEYGWSLDSITAPDGRELGMEQTSDGSWLYWQLWVDGEVSDVGASSVEVHDGTSIAWYYAVWGAAYPENGVAANPSAPVPDWQGSAGFGQSATTAPTPESATQTVWAEALKDPADWGTNVSDPVYYHGYLYVCAGSTIIMKDAATGKELRRATLVEPVDSIARMVAVDGLIIVPVHDGRLQALTADTLTTVWFTDALPSYQIGASGQDQQGIGSITVDGDRLYFVTAAAGWTDVYNGYVVCVDIATGTVLWQYENTASCFYWGGAATSGSWVVVADDGGTVSVLDAARGTVASTLDLETGSRAQVVSGSEAGTLLVVTKDGLLHKLALDEDTGVLRELASVKFGSSSTSTPVVADGKVYVGGASLEGYANSWGGTSYYGTIAVINESTLAIEHRIISTGGGYLPGEVKATPLVSRRGGSTYVYFTCNAMPGGVYRYRVGDKQAELIYTPGEDQQNYCMASVVCGSDGTLYYINDSGYLIAIKGAASSSGHGDDAPGKVPGGSGTASGSDDDGGVNRHPAGAVSPALQPLAATSDDEALEGAVADGSGAEGQASASVRATSALASDAAAKRGIPSWIPVAGIVVGVCGLAAIGIYLATVRKRS